MSRKFIKAQEKIEVYEIKLRGNAKEGNTRKSTERGKRRIDETKRVWGIPYCVHGAIRAPKSFGGQLLVVISN